ncbi:uncharacterized protein [Amphiura filiformis]|uniref:uncharacterized protein n=1 Tax=Amphiura filiformis TaxID=82378 RepID=UPI003B21D1CD
MTNYNLGNSSLVETTSHSYLGVEISQDLKWDTHISKVTASANKTLGFIRRNLSSCNKETKATAYTALVRPTVEYCASVWDPYTNEHIHEIGKIQRRAARMVCNDYQQTTSASGLIRSLDWDMLSTRRKITRVNVSTQSHRGHLALPVSDYLRPASRFTRRSNTNAYIPYHSRTNCFKNSFVPRTIVDWNSLPPDLQPIKEVTQFKKSSSEFFRKQDISNNIRD